MLNEAGSLIEVKDSGGMLEEDEFQSTGTRLDRLCSLRNLGFERTQGTFALAHLGRLEDVSIICKCCRESADSTRGSTRSAQCEIYAADVGATGFQRRRKNFL